MKQFLSFSVWIFDYARQRLYVRWMVKAVPNGYWFTRVGEIIALPFYLPLFVSKASAFCLEVEATLYCTDGPSNSSLTFVQHLSEQPSIN